MIFHCVYGHMYSIHVSHWHYSEIEKNAKNALSELWPTLRIHCPALLYLITCKSNVSLYDVNDQFEISCCNH